LAIYLDSYFTAWRSVSQGDEDFKEEDYKKMYEYRMNPNIKIAVDDEAEAEEFNCDDHFHDMEVDTKNSVYKKKSIYSYQDFITFYENIRFTGPFIIYRYMMLWPIIDFIATYGHLVSNLAILVAAINFSASFFMCFNILCVCLFYLLATQMLIKKAR